jgi:hypothetical protein
MQPEFSAAAVLGWTARGLAIASKTNFPNAERWLADNRAPVQAQRLFKAAIGAGSTSDSDLAAYAITIGAWSDAARTRSAFYRILADAAFVRLPFRAAIAIAVSSPSAALVPEGASIPVSRITLDNVLLRPMKANALIAVSDTLVRDVGPAAQSLFNRELLGAVSDAVDSAFVAMLIDTASPAIASTSPLADVRAALSATNSVGQPRLYWCASPDTAKLGSTLATNAPAFAAVSATGGELANLPLLVSSGLADGTLALLDAGAIAANGEAPTVEVSTQADIQMDTAPTMNSTSPTPATMTSMFQTNSAALRATAVFGCQKLRADAVSVVTGISATTWPTT